MVRTSSVAMARMGGVRTSHIARENETFDVYFLFLFFVRHAFEWSSLYYLTLSLLSSLSSETILISLRRKRFVVVHPHCTLSRSC